MAWPPTEDVWRHGLPQKHMRVVHILTSFEGGAGLCASRIMKATNAMGVDVRAIIAEGEKSEMVDVVNSGFQWSRYWLIRKVQALLIRSNLWPKAIVVNNKIEKELKLNPQPVCFTSPVTLYTKLADHPWLKEADIVHLHWVGNFVDYKSFFRHVTKPIVWTLHDENPGLGGFHYTLWKESASNNLKLLDEKLAIIKKNAYKKTNKMTLVAISNMMTSFIKGNELLNKFSTETIHNGIDGDAFHYIAQKQAREAINIGKSKTVFLFIAFNIHEERKGLKLLIEALEVLNNPDILLLCVGNYCKKPSASFDIRCEGFISDNYLLSLYYSAANLFVMPSFQEAFAQTPMEAMACGTPVISFPCSGAEDLICNNNGVICQDFTVNALIAGIKAAMNSNYSRDIIRKDLMSRFSSAIIAKQYYELYQKVLRENSL